jgi:hypothetical protein
MRPGRVSRTQAATLFFEGIAKLFDGVVLSIY